MSVDDSAIIILVLILVALGFGTYIFLMIFYPEWVGITGKEARKTLSEHEEGSQVDDRDMFSSQSSNQSSNQSSSLHSTTNSPDER